MIITVNAMRPEHSNVADYYRGFLHIHKQCNKSISVTSGSGSLDLQIACEDHGSVVGWLTGEDVYGPVLSLCIRNCKNEEKEINPNEQSKQA